MAKTLQEELIVKIKADVSELIKKIDQANAKVSGFAKKTKSVGQKLTKNISLPIVALGGVAVANAVKFEKLATSLNVLTGSADEGTKAFKRLQDFSAQTPFQLDDLVEVNNMLLGFGQSSDQAFQSLTMLSDISAVSGGDLSRMAVAFGQSSAAGRVMTQDLNQFINNGVPIFGILGDLLGKNAGEIRDLASEGKISFDVLNEAFRQATSEGGTFFKGTATLSQTLGGRLSTLRDNFNLMTADIGDLIGEALTPLVLTATKLMQRFRALNPVTKKIIVVVGGLLGIIGPLAIAIGSLIPIIATLGATLNIALLPVTAIIAGIAALTAGFIYVRANSEKLTNELKFLIQTLAQAGATILRVLLKPVELVIDAFAALSKAIGKPFEEDSPIKKFRKNLKEFADKDIKRVKVEGKSMGEALKTALGGNPVQNLSTGFKGLNVEIEDTKTKLKELKEINDRFVDTSLFGQTRDKKIRRKEVTPFSQESKFQPKQLSGGFFPVSTFTKEEREEMHKYEANLQRMADFTNQTNQAISNSFQGLAENVATSLGDAITGVKGFGESMTNIIFGTLADLAIKVGKIAIGVGIAVEGIKKALQTLNPVVAVIAGVALIALGTAVKGALANAADTPAFANGGIVGGTSFQGDRVLARVNSGEMILNKAQQGRLFGMINNPNMGSSVGFGGRLRGEDIFFSQERSTNRLSRYR